MMKSIKDRSFRPVDVAVAPDGSIFISDWYDPIIGGLAQRDISRGRLYRIAPKGSRYGQPKLDYGSAKECVNALKNPNYCVRYKAWNALHKMGSKAEKELMKMFLSKNLRHRARALWLMGKIEGRSAHFVDMASKDQDPNIRILALRLARQTGTPLIKVIEKMTSDPSAKVRRECAISLTHVRGDKKASLWASLAINHDAGDRWSLEALGIAAENDWDSCLSSWLKLVGDDWDTDKGKDIIWRSRAKESSLLIAKILKDPKVPEKDRPRYFRALDFQDAAQREEALIKILE